MAGLHDHVKHVLPGDDVQCQPGADECQQLRRIRQERCHFPLYFSSMIWLRPSGSSVR